MDHPVENSHHVTDIAMCLPACAVMNDHTADFGSMTARHRWH